MARLTPELWEEIKRKREAGASLPSLAAEYGVSAQAINKREKKDGWKVGKVEAKVEASTKSSTAAEPPSRDAPSRMMARARELVKPVPVMGRPTEYRPEFASMLVEYFMDHEAYREETVLDAAGNVLRVLQVPNKPLSLARFAVNIGVCRQTMQNWAEARNEDGSRKYPDFFNSYQMAKAYMEALLIEGGLSGAFQSNMTKFAMMNLLGWEDGPVKDADDTANLMPSEALLDATHDEAMAQAEHAQKSLEERSQLFAESEREFEGE